MSLNVLEYYINQISIILLIVTAVLLSWRIFYFFVGFFPSKKFKSAKTNHKYAILIPARNESKVITDILVSLKEQNYPKELFKTFVIVESNDDPTVEICKNFENTEVVVRTQLENRRRKGFALDDCVKHIKRTCQKFEGYIIFDADNVLDPNFICEINKAFDAGYEIVNGDRDCKNWNTNWVSASSALIFTTVNKFQNKCRAHFGANIVFSGTGMLISKKLLDQFDGWPFTTLTEDFEISLWGVANGVKTTQVLAAKFYDESPTKFLATNKQRIRWIKGYLQSRKLHAPRIREWFLNPEAKNKWSLFDFSFGITPVLMIVATMFFIISANVFLFIFSNAQLQFLIKALLPILGFYGFLMIYGSIMLFSEPTAKLSFKNLLLTILLYPFFSCSYVYLFFKALLMSEVEWVPTEHKVNITEIQSSVFEEELSFEDSSTILVENVTNEK